MPSAYHAQIGAHADGIADVLVTVGPLAAAMAGELPRRAPSRRGRAGGRRAAAGAAASGDVVLVKASNGVGLKLVCETLSAVTAA